jgi:hypothetical protein
LLNKLGDVPNTGKNFRFWSERLLYREIETEVGHDSLWFIPLLPGPQRAYWDRLIAYVSRSADFSPPDRNNAKVILSIMKLLEIKELS